MRERRGSDSVEGVRGWAASVGAGGGGVRVGVGAGGSVTVGVEGVVRIWGWI